MQKRIRFGKIFFWLVIVLTMLLYLVPLGYALMTSLKTQTEFLKNPVGFNFAPTLQNYFSAWQKASFQDYLINSVIYMVSCTAITLICAMLIAFPLARKYVRFSNGWYLFLMCGMFLPDGTIPLFQMMLKMNLYNTRIGYIISMLSIGGVCMMFFTSYMKGLPKELDEAAIIDGSGYFTYFFRVIVPLSKPAIASMTILTAIGVWNDIVKAVIFISTDKLFPITKGLFVFSGQYSTSWTELMAALIMVALPLVILYIFLQKQVVGGLTAGSVKM